MKNIGIAGLLAGAICLAGPAAQAGDPVAGHALARDLCSGCHLVDAGQRGPVVDGVPAFQTLARDPAIDDRRLEGFIADPHPPMPRVPLTAVEIDSLVAYIRSLAP